MPRWTIQLTALTAALVIALSGCGIFTVTSSRLPASSTMTIPLPASWYFAPTPDGRIFVNNSGFRGVVISPTDPEEIAGCGLSRPGGNGASTPVFLFSADAGRSWHTHAIPDVAPTTFCSIVADTILPQTFVLQTGVNWTTQLLMTRDNGATWQPLYVPSGYTVSLFGIPGNAAPALVNGHLIAGFLPAGQTSGFHLSDLTLTGGFVPLDKHLPKPLTTAGLPANTPPEAVAVDPTDPSHLYTMIYGTFGPHHNTGLTLYTTRNAGDSWQLLHEWPTATRLGIWASPDKQVYALDEQGSPAGLYSSTDGVTWQFTSLTNGNLALSPSGAVVLFNGQKIYSFDPQSRHQSLAGTLPPILASGFAYVPLVLDHPAPTLVLATSQGMFALPLKPNT